MLSSTYSTPCAVADQWKQSGIGSIPVLIVPTSVNQAQVKSYREAVYDS